MIAGKLVKSSVRQTAQQALRTAVTVTNIRGREIIDSRGNPTVEVDVHTTAGNFRGA